MSLRSLASLAGGWRVGRTVVALLALFAIVGGCGGGGEAGNQQQFALQAIGPAGGVATGGPVTLTIPPGALAAETSIAVLPELTPLPIVPPGNDPCLYAYAGPIFCCGPLSLQLAVPATLRVGYDEALIPAGLSELDLVLLVSDPATNNTVMVPKVGPSVTQYTVSNYFEDTNYNPLGHVAIGVRVCPQGRLLVQNNVQPALQGAAVAEGFLGGIQELYVVDPTGGVLPALVDTNFEDFNAFLASPSGDRVLLRVRDPKAQATRLMTVPLPGGGTPTTVFEDDAGAGTFLQAYDPHYGWLEGSSGDEVFCTIYQQFNLALVQGQGTTLPTQVYRLLRRDSATLPLPTLMRERNADFFYPDDLRQSANGDRVMMRWGTSIGQGTATALLPDGAVDTLTSPAAALLSQGQIPPNSSGGASPRFLTLSPDLYVVQNGATVERFAQDGTYVGTLFDPAFKGEVLVDFALAPDDETFAMVVNVPQLLDVVQQGPGTYETILALGTLTDGIQATYSFFSQQSVEELVWHPQQTGVFLQLSGFNPGFYRLEEGKGLFVAEIYLPVSSLTHLDVNRIDGRIAIVVGPFFRDLTLGEALPYGVYVSPATADDFQPVPFEEASLVLNARWIESWRNQPGMSSPRVR